MDKYIIMHVLMSKHYKQCFEKENQKCIVNTKSVEDTKTTNINTPNINTPNINTPNNIKSTKNEENFFKYINDDTLLLLSTL
jgi:hypothetical protein